MTIRYLCTIRINNSSSVMPLHWWCLLILNAEGIDDAFSLILFDDASSLMMSPHWWWLLIDSHWWCLFIDDASSFILIDDSSSEMMPPQWWCLLIDVMPSHWLLINDVFSSKSLECILDTFQLCLMNGIIEFTDFFQIMTWCCFLSAINKYNYMYETNLMNIQ